MRQSTFGERERTREENCTAATGQRFMEDRHVSTQTDETAGDKAPTKQAQDNITPTIKLLISCTIIEPFLMALLIIFDPCNANIVRASGICIQIFILHCCVPFRKLCYRMLLRKVYHTTDGTYARIWYLYYFVSLTAFVTNRMFISKGMIYNISLEIELLRILILIENNFELLPQLRHYIESMAEIFYSAICPD